MYRRKIKRKVGIVGTVSWETRDARTGEVIPEESGSLEEHITDTGLEELARILAQASASVGYEIAVGTGTTGPADGDTELESEEFRAEVTSQSASDGTFTAKLFLDTTQANGVTLSEAGLFHDGVLIDHSLMSPTVDKTSAKTVTIQIDISTQRGTA